MQCPGPELGRQVAQAWSLASLMSLISDQISQSNFLHYSTRTTLTHFVNTVNKTLKDSIWGFR